MDFQVVVLGLGALLDFMHFEERRGREREGGLLGSSNIKTLTLAPLITLVLTEKFQVTT